jgi:L-lactate dehydrogenase complex protein LldG
VGRAWRRAARPVTTREAFLDAVRREVARARPAFAAAPTLPPADPAAALAAALAAAARDREALLARFRARAEAAGAVVHGAATVAAAGAVVLALARERGAERVVSWSAGALGGLARALDPVRAAGLAVTPCPPGAVEGGPRATFQDAEAAADLGVTGADLGLAASGSVLLLSGPGRGRGVSLLPPVHVALLPASRVVPGLTEAALALQSWAAGADAGHGANAVLVTGPSRTADIELTLTRGVHGPREVHVVLLEGE